VARTISEPPASNITPRSASAALVLPVCGNSPVAVGSATAAGGAVVTDALFAATFVVDVVASAAAVVVVVAGVVVVVAGLVVVVAGCVVEVVSCGVVVVVGACVVVVVACVVVVVAHVVVVAGFVVVVVGACVVVVVAGLVVVVVGACVVVVVAGHAPGLLTISSSESVKPPDQLTSTARRTRAIVPELPNGDVETPVELPPAGTGVGENVGAVPELFGVPLLLSSVHRSTSVMFITLPLSLFSTFQVTVHCPWALTHDVVALSVA
jgi:hypothetical protein